MHKGIEKTISEHENPAQSSYIIGIGASAGGLEALVKFFDNMPPDSGMAFVVVQHLSPDYKSLMDELLSRHTEMEIVKITDGTGVDFSFYKQATIQRRLEQRMGMSQAVNLRGYLRYIDDHPEF